MKDPYKAIEDLVSILKKGGRLLISTSNQINPALIFDTLLPNMISEKITRRFGGPSPTVYERSRRLNPWKLAEKLRKCSLSANLLMFGFPQIGKPWLYKSSKLKPPKILCFWIVFDKLTSIKFLKKFKEIILVIAKK